MSKQELRSQISEISNELYQNSYCYGDKTEATLKRKLSKLRKELISLTPEFTPGAVIALDDFLIRINKPKAKDKAETKFFKDNEYQFSKEDK